MLDTLEAKKSFLAQIFGNTNDDEKISHQKKRKFCDPKLPTSYSEMDYQILLENPDYAKTLIEITYSKKSVVGANARPLINRPYKYYNSKEYHDVMKKLRTNKHNE